MVLIASFMSWEQAIVIIISKHQITWLTAEFFSVEVTSSLWIPLTYHISTSGGFWTFYNFTQVPLQPSCAAAKPRNNHAIWAQCCSLTTSPCPTLYACAEPKSQGHWRKWLHKLKVVWCIYASIAYNQLTCMTKYEYWWMSYLILVWWHITGHLHNWSVVVTAAMKPKNKTVQKLHLTLHSLLSVLELRNRAQIGWSQFKVNLG